MYEESEMADSASLNYAIDARGNVIHEDNNAFIQSEIITE
jgi:hypothetical protein